MIRYIVPIVSVAFLAGVGVFLHSHASTPTAAQEAPQATIAYQPVNARESWSIDFLAALGNVQPTPDTIAFVVEWTLAEDGSDGAINRGNPLNTTQPGFSENATINDDGVKGYDGRASGLAATVHTITNGLYGELLEGLQTNDPERAKAGLFASPWASSHYGYGVGWPSYHIADTSTMIVGATRSRLVEYALSLQGIPYISGGRSASGGDCSGTMQHIYLTVAGIDIGATTFSQYPNLQAIELDQARAGDLWFGQYANDQHTGMIADVDGDGRWDLINNGGLASNLHVDYDFLNTDYFNHHTMGYRKAVE